jgi:uncharacterized protein (DUF169 family)
VTDWTDATLSELAEALRVTLLLPDEPVGVRLFADRDEFAAWPAPRPRTPVFYCAAVRRATLGEALKLAREDISCDTSPRTLGLEPGFLDPGFVESYVTGGLYRDTEVAESVLSDVATLSGMVGVAVAPLGMFEADSPPDVVIIATSPYGAMRTVQAARYDGQRVRAESIGMHGICAESTALPYSTGETSVSLLCSGTRHVAGWGEDLMSVGIPMDVLPLVVAGLIGTADRYEPDERKEHMRNTCRRTAGAPERVRDSLGSLSDGTGYFFDDPD